MTYFKDIGKGSKNFFNLANTADDPTSTDYRLGETWSLSVNQGAQTIEGKRNGADGYLKYTQKSFLPEKPFKKLGGNLEVKLVNNDTASGKKPATAYEVALKKLSAGGASIDLEYDGGKAPDQAWKVKAKYGKLKDVNIYAEVKGEKGIAFKANATYTKNDYVAGLQISGSKDGGYKGYGIAAQWNRAEHNAKLSLELEGEGTTLPNSLTAKLQKQVSNDFSAYLMGKVDAAKGGNVLSGDLSTASNKIWLGGDFNLNDSSSLQLSVLGDSDGKGPGGLRAVYTHKLGDNLTGSLSFDSANDGDGGSVFSDNRIGWKLAFA